MLSGYVEISFLKLLHWKVGWVVDPEKEEDTEDIPSRIYTIYNILQEDLSGHLQLKPCVDVLPVDQPRRFPFLRLPESSCFAAPCDLVLFEHF